MPACRRDVALCHGEARSSSAARGVQVLSAAAKVKGPVEMLSSRAAVRGWRKDDRRQAAGTVASGHLEAQDTPWGLAVAREGCSANKQDKRLLKVCSSHVEQISFLREQLTAEQFFPAQRKPSRGGCGEPTNHNV